MFKKNIYCKISKFFRLSNKFIAKKIYKGYIDDPRNTDNAWIEAEIWNFHYCDQNKLDDLIPNVKAFLLLYNLFF